MKTLKVLALVCPVLVGCKAINAIDSTISMSKKMDTMVQKMGATEDGINKTTTGVHRQTLDAALKQMLDEKNSKYLFPPTGMLPGGEIFALEATPKELVEFTYVVMKEISAVRPDETKRKTGFNWEAYLEEMDNDKLKKLTVLMVIAGQTPQEKVETIIQDQIHGSGGRFEMYAYNFLLARALFIKGFKVDEGVFSGTISNLGMLREGINYAQQLEFLVSLPFADKVRLKTTGFNNGALNIDEALDINMTKNLWQRLDRAMKTELEERFRLENSSFARELAEMREVVQRNLAKYR